MTFVRNTHTVGQIGLGNAKVEDLAGMMKAVWCVVALWTLSTPSGNTPSLCLLSMCHYCSILPLTWSKRQCLCVSVDVLSPHRPVPKAEGGLATNVCGLHACLIVSSARGATSR